MYFYSTLANCIICVVKSYGFTVRKNYAQY